MPETVLVVDDEPGVVRLCQRVLERAGFRVETATQPQEGLACLERRVVDLLLVDIRMPAVDGFQVIDLARQRQPDLAVVIMTGFGTVELAVQALRRGADGLILKPFDVAELVDSVRRARQERQRKQDAARLEALRPLFDITESLFTETDPERLLNLLVDAVCGHLRCAHAAFYRREGGERRLRLIAQRGVPLPEEDSRMDGGIIGRADALSTPLLVQRDSSAFPELQAILVEHGLASAMAVPLAASATLKGDSGVLLAGRDLGEPLFGDADLEMFVILARQAAVALENARLHAELRAYIRRLEDSQRALVQAEKMATAGRLTASIAHEINNPLQAVQNCLHLAARKELSPETRQNYLELAQAELERLMTTVQRMLDFYRPGGLDRKPVDVAELVRRVLALVQKQLEDQGIALKTRLPVRPVLALAVSDQLQQVFLNLILNAMQAMPNGGELSIELSLQRKEIAIVFEDTGPGVSPEQREHLFEPFVSTKEGGTGLGLAVSYGIIAAHGGNLELIPAHGRGACFRVTLPVGGTS